MTLANGDLTTPQQVALWMGNATNPLLPSLPPLISSMSRMILNKINRSRLYSQTYNRTLNGVGNYQLMLPDYPVTSVIAVQMGAASIPPAPLPNPPPNFGLPGFNTGFGFRVIPWKGELPGSPAMMEFVNGVWTYGVQNIKAIYNAGYLVQGEAGTVPATGPYTITVEQPQGNWCRDNGVSYATSGTMLSPVASAPNIGEYIPPPDDTPGLYTFNAGDADGDLLFNYSFVPSDLAEACNQMVAERLSYRDRIGVISKSLGGQETIRFQRGNRSGMWPDLPPEVEGLILPYFNVTPPGDLGAPV